MTNLYPEDLNWCINRLPQFLRDTLKKVSFPVVVAGGFVRDCIAREPVSDIDLFVPTKCDAETLFKELGGEDEKHRTFKTDNAFTLRRSDNKTPIQIIHRWTFSTPQSVMPSFDFTVAQAGFWWRRPDSETAKGVWDSLCSNRFYTDLAARRLVYTSPKRIEEVGGSLLRVLKFYQRGYRIPLDSLAAVLARMSSGVDYDKIPWSQVVEPEKGPKEYNESAVAKVFYGLLREVDPAMPGHEHYERGQEPT